MVRPGWRASRANQVVFVYSHEGRGRGNPHTVLWKGTSAPTANQPPTHAPNDNSAQSRPPLPAWQHPFANESQPSPAEPKPSALRHSSLPNRHNPRPMPCPFFTCPTVSAPVSRHRGYVKLPITANHVASDRQQPGGSSSIMLSGAYVKTFWPLAARQRPEGRQAVISARSHRYRPLAMPSPHPFNPTPVGCSAP